MAIQIEISLWDNRGVAQGAGLRLEGRTIAEAVSKLLAKMAKDKDLIGKPWVCPENGLRGVVGEMKKPRPRRTYVNVAELGLEGGAMNPPRAE